MRILIVEDEAAHAEAVRRAFQDAGTDADIQVARTLREFRERVAACKPDTVLMDMNLPDGRALEVLTFPPENGPFPVLIMTSHGNEQVAVEAMKAGALDYIVKSPEAFATLPHIVVRAMREWRLLVDRRELDLARREREEEVAAIYANAPFAMVLVDRDRRACKVNSTAMVLSGAGESEVIGRHIGEVLRCIHAHGDPEAPGCAHCRLRRTITDTLETGANCHQEEVRIETTGDGQVKDTTFLISTTALTLHGESMVLVSLLDITLRKQGELALAESNRHLAKAIDDLKAAQSQLVQQERLRALGQMASGIAHDFNNALMPILGLSEVLLTSPTGLDDREKMRSRLEVINEAAAQAASVVQRLREFYRKREAREELRRLDLNEVVKAVVSLTMPKWKDQAQGSGIPLTVETDLGDIPQIRGDGASLREALTNLIFNAVDAMPHGGTLTLCTRRDTSSAAGATAGPADGLARSVTVEVRDTGVGMTDEVRAHCLEPFYSTKGEHGTGLGLAMVYGIVQRHGATLEIRSELGKGSSFILHFPEADAARGDASVPETEASGPRLHVLLVDDDPTVRTTLDECLDLLGHDVVTAADGYEGLEKLQGQPFDLVITDRAMPNMNGDRLAAAVKQLDPTTPVILLTGFGDLLLSTGERPPGVDLIVSKPLHLAGLSRAIARVMAKTAGTRPPTV